MRGGRVGVGVEAIAAGVERQRILIGRSQAAIESQRGSGRAGDGERIVADVAAESDVLDGLRAGGSVVDVDTARNRAGKRVGESDRVSRSRAVDQQAVG